MKKAKKVYIQYCYGEKEDVWTITYKGKRYGGLLKGEYENYLSEKLVQKIGLTPLHGTLEEIGRVEDLNTKERVVTYTLKVE